MAILMDLMPPVSSDAFRLAMRQLAAQVCLVTSTREGRYYGMTATSVCSVTLDPPTFLVCLNQNSATHEAVSESGVLCVNLLAVEHRELARDFGSAAAGAGKFGAANGAAQSSPEGLPAWQVIETGAPALSGALANLDCRVVQSMSHGTHSVFLARVVGLRCQSAGSPLLYGQARYGAFGALQPAGA